MKKKFSLKARLLSCRHALAGLKTLIVEEHNARLHLAAVILVTILGIVLKISLMEWLFVALAVGMVVVTEAVNSAVENLADHVSPEENELIKKTKDILAFAVFFAAGVSVFIGGVIFLPKLAGVLNLWS